MKTRISSLLKQCLKGLIDKGSLVLEWHSTPCDFDDIIHYIHCIHTKLLICRKYKKNYKG